MPGPIPASPILPFPTIPSDEEESLPGAPPATTPPADINVPYLVFPSDLEKIEYWIRFCPFQYTRANRSTPPSQGPYNAYIFLPVPGTLGTQYSMDYSQEELGVVGHWAQGMAASAKQVVTEAGGDMGKLAHSMADAWDQLWRAGVKEAAGGTSAIGLALDEFTLAGAVSSGLGIQRNPHLALIFDHVNFRSHRFAYQFVARSTEEAQTLAEIINVFKSSMHPSYVQGMPGNHLFAYPDEWQIDFAYPQFQIQPSVLSHFATNFHGQNVPAYHADRYPVEVHIELQFMEVTILTKEDIDAGLG